MKRTTVEEILKSRENRGLKQEKLRSQFKTSMISFTLNIPGEVKSNDMLNRAHEEGIKTIIDELMSNNMPIIYHEKVMLKTGDEAYFLIDCDVKKLKGITVSIENTHPLGRLFDFDVFDAFGNQIKRELIGANKRTCVICNGNTQICRHLNKHPISEVLMKYNQIMNEYFVNN